MVGNNTAVVETAEDKSQVEANRAFKHLQSRKRALHDAQEIFKGELLDDKDYAAYNSDSKELNAHKRELKKRLISDHPDIKKKHEDVIELKRDVKEAREVVKGYGIESLQKGEQLSLFDSYEGQTYKFNIEPRFAKVKESKSRKKKPVIENIADSIDRDLKHEAAGKEKMEAK